MPGRHDQYKAEWRAARIRPCCRCKLLLPWEHFGKLRHGLFGLNTECKACRKTSSKAHWKSLSIARRMVQRARSRATQRGLACTITEHDIVIPTTCPILGVPLERTGIYVPSIDRIDATKGYTPDNIQIISNRANVLKNNGTIEEFQMLMKWLTRQRNIVPLHTHLCGSICELPQVCECEI